MYEMRMGPDEAGTGFVWHVLAEGTRSRALCGGWADPPTAQGHTRTERHCGPCLNLLRERMRAPAATGVPGTA